MTDDQQKIEQLLTRRIGLDPTSMGPHLVLLAARRRMAELGAADLGVLLDAAPCQHRLSTRIILVNDAPDGQNREEDRGRPGEALGPAREDGGINPDRDGHLLGLIAEQVSDLTRVQPEQVVPAPVHLTRAPYLDAIAQTDSGFVPLIAVPKLSLVLGR